MSSTTQNSATAHAPGTTISFALRQLVLAIAAFASASVMFNASTASAETGATAPMVIASSDTALPVDADTPVTDDAFWTQSDDAQPVGEARPARKQDMVNSTRI